MRESNGPCTERLSGMDRSGKLLGCLRVKAGSERQIDTNHHGWLELYGGRRGGELLLIDPESGQDLLNPVRGEWFEYRAKFTDGGPYLGVQTRAWH